MSFRIITLLSFDKELKKLAKKYPSMKMDYSALLDDLEVNPNSGNIYRQKLLQGSFANKK